MHALRDNFLTAVRHDPRRTAVLALLLTVLGIMIWRYTSGGPNNAVAETKESTATAAEGTEADISRSADLVARWREQPVPHLSRNLFAGELMIPLPEGQPAARAADSMASPDGLFWRQLEQALAARADREQYRQKLTEAAVKDATALNLQSIVLGADPWAMIGGKIVRVGDILGTGERGPFTLVIIESKRVILARDGQRVSLSLGRTEAELVGYE